MRVLSRRQRCDLPGGKNTALRLLTRREQLHSRTLSSTTLLKSRNTEEPGSPKVRRTFHICAESFGRYSVAAVRVGHPPYRLLCDPLAYMQEMRQQDVPQFRLRWAHLWFHFCFWTCSI